MTPSSQPLRDRSTRAAHPSRRGGFTLVELLVSMFVLSVGLLALTGASAVVARQLAGGAQLTLAATTAQSRFEIMQSRDCATIEAGASIQHGISERWSVTRVGPVIEVTDTITIEGRSHDRVHAFRTSVPCPVRP